MKEFKQGKNGKGRGQVRDERAPVYTASYKVNHSDELMEFLLKKCKTSRNNVKALLTRRQVLVNGGVVTQYNFPLAKDDEVKIAKESIAGGAAAKRTARTQSLERKSKMPRLKILLETEEFLAVEKPVGLLSVESDKERESAYFYALEYLKENGKTARPYILHRIDKETSGVLLFAKNPKIHSILKMHWNESVTTREYIAVAEGTFENKSGTIVSYLKENKNNLMYSTQDPSGQKAVTHYEVLKENSQYSLLRVKIDTGRKNQIRVQLQAHGNPIVGDDKYGEPKNPLKRLGLHASKLEFIHPITKEIVSIASATPREFYDLF
jgi:23S rRNA pseudouridine1911/1915/1917 synthase